MGITNASLAVLEQALSVRNCGVTRVVVVSDATDSHTNGGSRVSDEEKVAASMGVDHQESSSSLGKGKGKGKEEGHTLAHVTETMASRLAAACLRNTDGLLQAASRMRSVRAAGTTATTGATLELDWGCDAVPNQYEHVDEALVALANILVKTHPVGGGVAAATAGRGVDITGTGGTGGRSLDTLNLRRNQSISRAACARVSGIFESCGVRCFWPDRIPHPPAAAAARRSPLEPRTGRWEESTAAKEEEEETARPPVDTTSSILRRPHPPAAATHTHMDHQPPWVFTKV
jgi:hypothetical protein